MTSRVHPRYKTKYRVGNWPAYDRALVQRGDVTLWLTPEAIATWEAVGVGKRGGQLQYSEVAIETSTETLWPFLGECLAHFSPDECRNYFRHCGYSAATRS